MNYLILGSTAGLGRALSEKLAQAGHHLFLLASDARDLQAQCADLKLRYGIQAHFQAIHISANSERSTEEFLTQTASGNLELRKIDGLFFPIGAASSQDQGFLDEREAKKILEINFTCITSFVSHFLSAMIQNKNGIIVGFGSIASVRGRGANVIYSAAKRALECYFESLRHLTADTGVLVQFYQIGYLDTQQTYGKKLLFPKCNPDQAAEIVTRNLTKDLGHRFLPRFWWFVAILLRFLPWSIFKKLKF